MLWLRVQHTRFHKVFQISTHCVCFLLPTTWTCQITSYYSNTMRFCTKKQLVWRMPRIGKYFPPIIKRNRSPDSMSLLLYRDLISL
uniref:Secreted protein n=1 Tax=Mesocestoides corti TaxID=53468 RepID=A0A5K3EKC6_MESCO